MRFLGNSDECLFLISDDEESSGLLNENREDCLSILWFTGSENSELIIDGREYNFKGGKIIFLTEFHRVTVNKLKSARLLQFNRSFYCILGCDLEVCCKGALFFGASQLPSIEIPEEEREQFENLWNTFTLEIRSNDPLQIEMLRMILKRHLIFCTKIYRSKENYPQEEGDSETLREFNFLVQKHYKTKSMIGEYANLMNKSPKTISNIFLKSGSRSPLQLIHDRKMLEARRLLYYTNLPIKEVAYEIGFDDIQAFSRFFRKHEGVPPRRFRELNRQG